MTILQALILGIVQGLTEFLPISSSGHLALFQQWFGIQQSTLSFDVFLHAASLVAIVVFFWAEIKKLKIRDYWLLGIGTIPAVVVGWLFKDAIETALAVPLLIGFQFIINGGINAAIHHRLKKPVQTTAVINEKSAFTIGIFQALALIPAISRSGTTLLGGLWQKLDKERAFAFTFLLAIPAILGANVFQLFELLTNHTQQSFVVPVFLIGGLASLLASLWSLRLLKQFLVQSRFMLFSWYCLALGSAIVITQLMR